MGRYIEATMKVIFVTNIPFIRQHRIDMYVDAIASVYETELWDLSIAFECRERIQNLEPDSVKISSMEEFRQKLAEEKKNTEIVLITGILLFNLKKIYPIVHGMDIPIININKEAFASWMGNEGYLNNLKGGGVKTYLKALLRYNGVARRINKMLRFPGVKYDYMLSSYNFYPEESRNFVKIHHIKYDEFVAAKYQNSIINGKYILFVDAALADHPMYTGNPRKIDRRVYLQQLNKYFHLLEDKYKIKVVISAHPKSNYSKDDFNGRDVIVYKTPVLIAHASYVVSHYSTSLIDVVLHKKPLKVLYSKELMQSVCRYCTAMGLQMADMLHVEKVDLNAPKDSEFWVDEIAYQDFTDKYIINKEHADKTNKEQILDFLAQINE